MNDGTRALRIQGLDVLDTGLNLAELDLHGGEGLWDEVRRFCRESRLEAVVDGAMGGRAAPRVWALQESPGGGPAAAAAALGIATVLADRGQAVVLVDADEQEPRITRWLGRTEQEGWIDIVRFGASLHAASDPLPSDGRRGSALGVGSFAPTGVTPDEVAELLGRLRRQADDLVLVVPAKLRSLPWLEAAGIRLLSWDLLARSGEDTERILNELERMGAAPHALLGFGVEEFHAIQDRLRETDATRTDAAAATAPAGAAGPDAAAAEREAAQVEPVMSDDLAAAETEISPALGPEGAVAESAPAEPQPVPTAADATETEPAPGPLATGSLAAESAATEAAASRPPKRRTSGVFVGLAVVAVAALVGLGLFLTGQFGSPTAPGDGVSAARVDQRTTTPAGQQRATPPPAAGQAAEQDVGAAADGPGADRTPAVQPVPADEDAAAGGAPAEAPVEPGAAAEAGEDTAGEPTPAGQPETPPAPQTAPQPQPRAPAGASEATPAGPTIDLARFDGPVGAGGWTLWLYSFPEAEGAEQQVRELARRGLQAEYRAVELADRGRWFRVFAGSFASRDEARAAVAGVQAYLDHDWVIPSRF